MDLVNTRTRSAVPTAAPWSTVLLAAALCIAAARPGLAQSDPEEATEAATEAEPAAGDEAAPEPEPALDAVMTRDGSIVLGEVVTMTEASLKVKTVFGSEVTVKWEEVTGLRTHSPMPFVLADGTQLVGTADVGEGGTLRIDSKGVAEPATIRIDQVTAIKPPKVKPVKYKGSASIGLSITDGNTRTRTASLLGDFEARSERQRLTLRGAYNYAENQQGITARNGKAGMKYDFFPLPRYYIYASSLFEHDTFQDMSLRTALSAGPGYQFLENGDIEHWFFSGLEAYGEAGLAYFDEDRRRGRDETYVSARWSMKVDWAILPGKLAAFHFHEGYPGLENQNDLYIVTEQGVRFNLLENLIATFQVNWRWDNTPSPGFQRSDTLYLFTLGYSFDM